MTKRLVDIDDDVLSAAQAELGSDTIKATVNTALGRVAMQQRKKLLRVLLVVAAIGSFVIVADAPVVQAHSRVPIDPIDAVSVVTDAVLTGTAVDDVGSANGDALATGTPVLAAADDTSSVIDDAPEAGQDRDESTGCADTEECPNPITPTGRELSWQVLVVVGGLLAVFAFGLRAIKRQRDEGRRSKLPPIG